MRRALLWGIVLVGLVAVTNPVLLHAAESTVPLVTGLVPTRLPLVPGATGTVTVTINSVQTTETVIALQSSDPTVAFVPATVTVPAGAVAVPVPVVAGSPGAATLMATLNGSTAQTRVTVTTGTPAVVSLLPPVLPLTEGITSTLTITLNAIQPTDTEVALTTSDPTVVQLPGDRVTVPAHTLTVPVPVTGLSRGTATVTASLAGSTSTAAITVNPPPPTLVGFACPATATVGATIQCTVTLNAAQPGETAVPTATDAPGVLTVPVSITVPAGELSVPVPVSVLSLGIAVLTAGPLHETTQTAHVQVLPPPPTLVSLLPNPASLGVGATTTLTLTLNAAQVTETVVPLTLTRTGIVTVSPTLTVPAGTLTVPVPVSSLTVGSAVLTAGPLNGSQVQADLTVTPRAPTITGLTPGTLELPQGTAEPLTVTIVPTQPDATTIPLASSDPTTVEVPPSVPVPAGETSAPFPVIGRAVGTATVTAGPLHGPGKQATVTVRPPDAGALTIAPAAASLHPGEQQAFTVRATTSDGTTQDLTSVVAWTSDAPRVATLTAGGVATAVADGAATITARHPDGRTASAFVTVSASGLRVTGFTPTSGPVGERVTVSGSGFIGVSAVTFNGVAATSLTVDSATTFTAEVPVGATTGPIAVTTPAGTATSASVFTVLAADALGLTVAPAEAITVAGAEATYILTRTDGPGGGLARLAVAGLPSGATAQVNPPTLGPNQDGLLTVQTAATTPAGVYTLTLTATGERAGRPVTATHALTLSVLAPGQTVLVGRIVDTHRRAIRRVTIQLVTETQTLETTTDAAGSFLLPGVPAGQQLVLVDGHPASHAQAKYPTIPITVTIRPGVVNRLPFTPHLHAQKDRNFTHFSPDRETVATDPELPGVALRIPKGAQIIGWDGQPNTKVSIHTVPSDRLPVAPVPPEARGGTVYMFYFGKKGGGVATQSIPFEAPNDLGLPPGAKAVLWYFDESPVPGRAPNAWRKAGLATVTADGTLIRTNPGVGIPKFCCGASTLAPVRTLPDKKPGPTAECGKGTLCNDPVDVSTGIFLLTATDLALPGRYPLRLTRTYRSGDPWLGPFGPGWTLGYDDFLQYNQTTDIFTYVYDANAATEFYRAPGQTYYINTAVPAFRGARITPNDPEFGLRTLRFKDGRALVFNLFGWPVQRRDRTGNTLTLERHGEDDNIINLREPSGRAFTLGYAPFGFQFPVRNVQDPLGRLVQYEYDTEGRLVTVTDPLGGITRYAYDAEHRMTSITDPRNVVKVQNTYDTNSRVCQQQLADSGIVRYFYITADRAALAESEQLLTEAAAGGPISQTPCSALTATMTPVAATVMVDARGKPTTFRFNAQGYLIQTTDALGQITTYTRQADTNLLLSITDPLNRVTQFQYDANGNVTQRLDALNHPWTFTYDPTFNQVTSATDPLGNLTTFEYDTSGNLTAITAPEENLKPAPDRLKTRMTYNSYGQVLTVSTPLNQTTTVTYTTAGDLDSVTDPLGHETTRTYDGVSRLLTATDPLGRITWYAYDGLDRVTTLADPLQGLTYFTYDANGNLLTVRDPLGQTTTHTYDGRSRLATRTDPLGKAETFQYDGNGNLTSTTDRKTQTTTYTYDALNRRTAEQSNSGTIAYTYDAGSRLTQADDTADPHRPITFTYDLLDRLLSETTALGAVSYTYDAAGRRLSLAVSGQAPVSYTYDRNARLRTITQAPLNPVAIDYDAANRRTLLTLPNGVSTEYQYDLASRLTALIYRNAVGLLGDLTYQYDAAGNRISTGGSFARTLVPDAVSTSSYDAGNRQLGFATQTFTYDDNGNRLTQTDPSGTITYTWDARNRLVALTGPATSATFAYDALGRRVSKTISGVTTTYLYDGLDAVKESSGGVDTRYLRTLSIDEALVRTDATDTVHYLGEALGSTVALTNPAGTAATTYTFEPFGRTEVTGAPNPNPFRFTGREDDGTGLYYYRARYYDLTRSRFVSEDPIGFEGGINAYTYVDDSPLNFTDPSGEVAAAIGIRIAGRMLSRAAANTVARAAAAAAAAAAVEAARRRCEEECGPDTRAQAMAKAYAFAGIPPGGGDCVPIPWRDYNNKGRGYAEVQRQGSPCMGYTNYPSGRPKVEEHPDGHADTNQPHHRCPHFNATNAAGDKQIFPYKRWP